MTKIAELETQIRELQAELAREQVRTAREKEDTFHKTHCVRAVCSECAGTGDGPMQMGSDNMDVWCDPCEVCGGGGFLYVREFRGLRRYNRLASWVGN